jgi:hypothetical protein
LKHKNKKKKDFLKYALFLCGEETGIAVDTNKQKKKRRKEKQPPPPLASFFPNKPPPQQLQHL